MTTLIARRAQFHQVHLVGRLAGDNPAFQTRVAGLAHQLAGAGLGTLQAHEQAYARLYNTLLGQAQTLAYIDTYWLLAACGAAMAGLSFLLKKNNPGTGGQVAAH